jgi:N-sulfoglucosamine sulfohydrolase
MPSSSSGLIFAVLALLAASLPAADPPNILFAIADDWGRHAGAYGTRWVRTPAFDRLAREGLLFENAYTPMAKCAPSRACILTGRHLWQNREAGNHLAVFPPDLTTWPEALAARGWHLGLTAKGWGPGVARDAAGRPRQLVGPAWNHRQAAPPTPHIHANDYAANFADFLDAAPPGKPWCFWFGALEPHRAYEFQSGAAKGGKHPADIDRVPACWPDHETVRHDLLDYAFEVEHFDRHLGRMLAELERRGLLDRTLVIATSDHGMPFPRVKGHAYHAANHVPLALRWPGGVKAPGRAVADFVDFTDLAATILEVAGIAPESSGMQPLTGTSWLPILAAGGPGQVVAARDHTLIGKERTDVGRPRDQGYPIRGIVTRGHLYLRNYEPARWPAGNPETGYLDTDGSPTKSLILERGRRDRGDRFWQLNFGFRPAEELFDLTADPDCVDNLAADPAHAGVAATLRARMEAALSAQGDPRMAGRGGVFDNYVPTGNPGYYEKYLRGEAPKAQWVEPGDYEAAPLASATGMAGYLFAHFTGEDPAGEQIHFALSTDGLNWTDLNNSQPVLVSTIGEMGVRDPSLLRKADGSGFILLATDLRIASGKGWEAATSRGSTSLVIWESRDLVNWSEPRLADVASTIPGAGCAWAPEAIHDPARGDYFVCWATIVPVDGGRKARIYGARTRDFRAFSPPDLIIARDGRDIIDTQIVATPGAPQAFVRVSCDGQISFEGADALAGPWRPLGDLSAIGFTGKQVEGPILFKFNDRDKWCLLLDQYSSGRGYLPFLADAPGDPRSFAVAPAACYSLGASRKRHGGILPVTGAEMDALRAKWPGGATRP